MRTLFVSIFALFILSTQAQVPGYRGKRFMVKADILSPFIENGTSMILEYNLARKLNIYGGMSFSQKRYNQNIGTEVSDDFPITKARIQDAQAQLGVRFFTNNALPAPVGYYTYLEASYGRAQARGFYYNEGTPNIPPNSLLEFEVTGIRSTKVNTGFGVHYILFDFLVVDFNFGITFGKLQTSPVHPDEDFENYNFLFDNFRGDYGPNIISLGRWSNDPGGFGLSSNLKVGFIF